MPIEDIGRKIKKSEKILDNMSFEVYNITVCKNADILARRVSFGTNVHKEVQKWLRKF